MKKIVLACALLATGFAKGSNYATTFTITGGITSVSFTSLQLDITSNARYYGVNGALVTASGLGSPVSGTCQVSSSGGIFCLLQSGFVSYIVDLGPNLTGLIKANDQNGNITATAPLTITSVK